MWVDRQGQVRGDRPHLDRQRPFGDQLTGAHADDADAQHSLGAGLDHDLGQATWTIQRRRTAGGAT